MRKKPSIVFSTFFFLFLLGLIGFNVLINYSTTDSFLALIIELLKQFSLVINLWLISMSCISSIPIIIVMWNNIAFVIQKKRQRFSVPEVEEKILQILNANRGKSLSCTSLIEIVNFPGSLGDFNAILKRLREENKINRDSDDYPFYSVI